MYIRIQDKAIRYRVSKKEAEELINDETLFDDLNLSDQFKLCYSINAVNRQSNFSFSEETNLMSLQINKDELIAELNDRPSKQGIEVKEIQSQDKNLSVFLEVDIKRAKK